MIDKEVKSRPTMAPLPTPKIQVSVAHIKKGERELLKTNYRQVMSIARNAPFDLLIGIALYTYHAAMGTKAAYHKAHLNQTELRAFALAVARHPDYTVRPDFGVTRESLCATFENRMGEDLPALVAAIPDIVEWTE